MIRPFRMPPGWRYVDVPKRFERYTITGLALNALKTSNCGLTRSRPN